MEENLKRRVARAVGLRVTRKLLKSVPIVGAAAAIGMAGYEIRRKGLLPGALSVGTDLIPFVGTAKNLIEIFTGDLIPDKKNKVTGDGRG